MGDFSATMEAAAKSLKELSDAIPREPWHYTYDSDEHTCQCAVVMPPCWHCTDCPDCNCEVCDDFHNVGAGDLCMYCPECKREVDKHYRHDGECSALLQVSTTLTQANLEDIFYSTNGDIGDKLAAVARATAYDIVSLTDKVTEPGSYRDMIMDDYELSRDVNDEQESAPK